MDLHTRVFFGAVFPSTCWESAKMDKHLKHAPGALQIKTLPSSGSVPCRPFALPMPHTMLSAPHRRGEIQPVGPFLLPVAWTDDLISPECIPSAMASETIKTQFKVPEGRYVLHSAKQSGLVPFALRRTTRLTIATLHGGDEEGMYMVYNVGDYLHVSPFDATEKVSLSRNSLLLQLLLPLASCRLLADAAAELQTSTSAAAAQPCGNP